MHSHKTSTFRIVSEFNDFKPGDVKVGSTIAHAVAGDNIILSSEIVNTIVEDLVKFGMIEPISVTSRARPFETAASRSSAELSKDIVVASVGNRVFVNGETVKTINKNGVRINLQVDVRDQKTLEYLSDPETTILEDKDPQEKLKAYFDKVAEPIKPEEKVTNISNHAANVIRKATSETVLGAKEPILAANEYKGIHTSEPGINWKTIFNNYLFRQIENKLAFSLKGVRTASGIVSPHQLESHLFVNAANRVFLENQAFFERIQINTVNHLIDFIKQH